jgi:hypothetical protein
MLNFCLRLLSSHASCSRASSARSFGLLVTLLFAGLAGCHSDSLVPPLPASTDGAVDRTVFDAAACGCEVVDGKLTISWDCYVATYGGQQALVPYCNGTAGEWTIGCGLEVYAISTVGGPEAWVYDQNGSLVGILLGTDDGYFSCPSDPSLQGFALQAGVAPNGCEAAYTCPCVDSILGCPVPGGG